MGARKVIALGCVGGAILLTALSAALFIESGTAALVGGKPYNEILALNNIHYLDYAPPDPIRMAALSYSGFILPLLIVPLLLYSKRARIVILGISVIGLNYDFIFTSSVLGKFFPSVWPVISQGEAWLSSNTAGFSDHIVRDVPFLQSFYANDGPMMEVADLLSLFLVIGLSFWLWPCKDRLGYSLRLLWVSALLVLPLGLEIVLFYGVEVNRTVASGLPLTR